MDRSVKIFIVVFTLLIGSILALLQGADKDVPVNPAFPYDLDNPTTEIKLHKDLREVSGLALVNDSTVAAVQDEKGSVFLINNKSGKVRDKIKFGKDGDYEGVAFNQRSFFAVRSDGKIYRIRKWTSDKIKTKNFETDLGYGNDVEGLCFDKVNNSLLLVCKNKAGIDKKIKDHRAVYSFDLRSKTLDIKPVLLIDLKKINKQISKVLDNDFKKNIMPSGIAINPRDSSIYILSSVAEVLLIFDRSGKLINCSGLPDKYFLQPEGICFDAKGTMYIANEGHDKKARLLKFIPKQF